MAKKNLLVFTGGTISAYQKDGEIVRGQKSFELLKGYKSSDFDILEPVDILSENMTPQILFQIFREIIRKIKGQSYRSIIVTHGTDTLAYTAQLGTLLFSSLPFPVIFLGSKLPSDHPESDGKINFSHALQLAEKIRSGVFVVSRQQTGHDVIFAAESIQQANFTEDDFSAFQNNILGWFKDGELIENAKFRPYSQINNQNFQYTDVAKFLQLLANPDIGSQQTPENQISSAPPIQYTPEAFHRLFELEKPPTNHSVLMIPAYPGQNYSLFDLNKFSGKYILHQMYHSGTACIQGEPFQRLTDFAKRCKKDGKQLFIAPIYRDRPPYETTAALLKEDVIPFYDMPSERAWAILTLVSWMEK